MIDKSQKKIIEEGKDIEKKKNMESNNIILPLIQL
jgi:hypothetical protein